jgi:hypothetical protein
VPDLLAVASPNSRSASFTCPGGLEVLF